MAICETVSFTIPAVVFRVACAVAATIAPTASDLRERLR